VAPLRLSRLRGKQSTPSDWLGGTGEVSTVGEQERQGARDVIEAGVRQRYGLLFGRVECVLFTSAIITVNVLEKKVNGLPFLALCVLTLLLVFINCSLNGYCINLVYKL